MRLPRPIHFQAILIWQDLNFTEVSWKHKMKGIEAYVYFGIAVHVYCIYRLGIYEAFPPQRKNTHIYVQCTRTYVLCM
jgi:hypothetical protein